ncbi:MAG: hypothetical protein CM15mP30_5000 [Pelagibacteraceae bacterium]|nr:MAG: hypothetical protein CM15mP30_5000 [Pelagibacteraceae bacterium]
MDELSFLKTREGPQRFWDLKQKPSRYSLIIRKKGKSKIIRKNSLGGKLTETF